MATQTMTAKMATASASIHPLSTAYPTHQIQKDSLERFSYLFGYPISHTLSPIIHHAVYETLDLPWRYFLHESTSIPSFLELTRDPKFYGAAVTMPHKVAIIPYLDDLTPEGRAIGAVNTIFLQEDQHGARKLIGTNTDCIGIREALKQNISAESFGRLRGRPGLIIGGGGTSRAAVYALKHWIGCSHIYFINRDPSEVETVMRECTVAGFGDNLIHVSDENVARSLPEAAVIVSAVPDVPPRTDFEFATRRCVEIMLERGSGPILEMCYHPSPRTQIAGLAGKAGWQVISGTEAMVWQALEQDRFWTGRQVDEMGVDRARGVLADALTNH